MRNYEIMYILKADLDEAARNEEMEKSMAFLLLTEPKSTTLIPQNLAYVT